MSPDGSLIATVSEDSSWKMWDAASGRELLVVEGHDGQGACVCPMDDKGLRAEVRTSCPRVGHGREVIEVAFSPCGQRIATAGGENETMIWSAFTGEQELRLALPRIRCTMAISVAFSSDSSKIATGSDDERICVWDARNGELLRTILNAHAGGIESVCFSPDGLHLASVGGDDGRGKIWDARSGAPVRELENKRGDDSACIKFAPGGRFVAAGSTAGSVTLWDVESGEEALCLHGHTGRAPYLGTLPLQGYPAHRKPPPPMTLQ
jgi:WD40 repeat protein